MIKFIIYLYDTAVVSAGFLVVRCLWPIGELYECIVNIFIALFHSINRIGDSVVLNYGHGYVNPTMMAAGNIHNIASALVCRSIDYFILVLSF